MREVWNEFMPNYLRGNFFTHDVWTWLRMNVADYYSHEDWNLTSVACMWSIWTRRNEAILGNSVKQLNVAIHDVFSLLTDLRSIFPRKINFGSLGSKSLGWERP